jgi:hypothetical protein
MLNWSAYRSVWSVPILWIFDGGRDADAFDGIALLVSMVSKVSKVFCPIGILNVFPIS